MTEKNTLKMKVTDMTKGSPIRLILMFALPILIGNVFQQIYSIVDTMVAGYNLGDEAIAAIGATSSLYGLIINLAWGMNNGFALAVTRAFGAHDNEQIRKSVAGTMVLDTSVSVVLTVLSLLFLRPLMRLMNTPESIFEEAYSYMFIICAGILATIAYNLFASLLRAFGNSIVPLYFLIFSSILNIILDVLFVGPLGMGVAGAAFATILSQLIAAVLSGIYFFRHYKTLIPRKADFAFSKELLVRLLSDGAAMGFMYCVIDLGSVFFQSATNALAETMGEGIITAHTAARRLILIMMAPLFTISEATSTYFGQNYGAGEMKRVKAGLKYELSLMVIWAAAALALIYIFGAEIVRFTTGTNDAEIIGNAVLSLRIHLPFYAPLGALFALRTMMQAIGIKTPTIVSSSIELGMKILAALWLIPQLGFIGTCITEPITWVLCAVYLVIVFVRKRKQLFG